MIRAVFTVQTHFIAIVAHSLREMCEAQEEVMKLLQENGTIIRRFQRLTALTNPATDEQ